MKRNRTEILITVSDYGNFHFFCDFFLTMKFKAIINNLKWNRKKIISIRNVILAFGVAGRLLSVYKKIASRNLDK